MGVRSRHLERSNPKGLDKDLLRSGRKHFQSSARLVHSWPARKFLQKPMAWCRGSLTSAVRELFTCVWFVRPREAEAPYTSTIAEYSGSRSLIGDAFRTSWLLQGFYALLKES